MTREERLAIRRYVAENPMEWPPLSDWQRARLAVLLRPDRMTESGVVCEVKTHDLGLSGGPDVSR